MRIETIRPITAFHVSYTKNEESIINNGLIPQTGDRSAKLNDAQGIYLFKTMDDVENALMNWLGDELDEDEPITIFQVVIPEPSKLLNTNAEYELVYNGIIPPKYIKVYDRQ